MSSKLAFITGATSGIGKATAELFAANHWNLILIGRREDRLASLAQELQKKYSIDVLSESLDVQSLDEIKAFVHTHSSMLSKLDILVNNAGLALGKEPFDQGDYADWNTMIDTNLKGLIYMTKEIVPFFKSKKSGHIINISSTAAKTVYPGGNVYSATKFAVDGLSQSLRIDLLPYNIKVTSIAPGMVNTEFSKVRFHGDSQKADEVYQGFTPLMAQDIADTIFYAATRPSHVCINELVVTCTAQANSVFLHKQ